MDKVDKSIRNFRLTCLGMIAFGVIAYVVVDVLHDIKEK